MRSAFTLVAPAVLAALTASCINPRDDYDDFVNRTNGVRGVSTVVSDAAVQEAAAIDGGFTAAPFFFACLPSLVGGRVAKALRFAGTITYTPTSTSTKAGTLDITFKPLAVGAMDLTPASQIGASISALGSTVADDGTFHADFGAPTILQPANPISANDIVFGSVRIDGDLLRSDFVCGQLRAIINLPQMLDLTDDGNFCIMQRVTDLAQPPPTLTPDEFLHCP